jgi:hypothetical protein
MYQSTSQSVTTESAFMITVSFTDGTNYAERVFNRSLNKTDWKEIPWTKTTAATFISFHGSDKYLLLQPQVYKSLKMVS